ncbi:hypothetical protein Q0Z83_085340 [Actinoplanes sichuanensis]|nr:hypothetical protein Q0Z83_085340 [Actinoplanes sichuanensis]
MPGSDAVPLPDAGADDERGSAPASGDRGRPGLGDRADPDLVGMGGEVTVGKRYQPQPTVRIGQIDALVDLLMAT